MNPQHDGTKVAAHYQKTLAPGESWTIRLRLTAETCMAPFDAFFDTPTIDGVVSAVDELRQEEPE